MALGTGIYVTMNLAQMLKMHGISVPVTRYSPEAIKRSNVFGTPNDDSNKSQFNAVILIDDWLTEDHPMMGGSKKIEHVYFVCAPDTFQIGDEFEYNHHFYKIGESANVPLAGKDVLQGCKGDREVDL